MEGDVTDPLETSLSLAALWQRLSECQQNIDEEIIPRAGHLSLEDPDLMLALESLSGAIRDHFEKFRLVAVPQRRLTPR
jgi:hypothetical protein